MKRWKLASIVFGIILVVVGSLYFFLRSYDPKPDQVRRLVYILMPNYGVVSTIAELTNNNRLVIGYFSEDIRKNPSNYIAPNPRSIFNQTPDSVTTMPSFHKDLVNLSGVVDGIDLKNERLRLRGGNEEIQLRKFTSYYRIRIGLDRPISEETGYKNFIDNRDVIKYVTVLVRKSSKVYDAINILWE